MPGKKAGNRQKTGRILAIGMPHGPAGVSVIIPAHNEEKHIGRCVDSVKAQTLKPYEIIVVANACSDRTADIAKGKGARVVVLEKAGVSRARNAGIGKAKGNILLFIDADTVMSRKLLESARQAIDEGYAGGICRVKGDSGTVRSKVMWWLANFFNNFYILPYGSFFCKKEYAGRFREDLSVGEDALFLKEVRKKGRLKFIKDAYVTTSDRRFEAQGYLRTIFGIIFNYFSRKGQKYDPVR